MAATKDYIDKRLEFGSKREIGRIEDAITEWTKTIEVQLDVCCCPLA